MIYVRMINVLLQPSWCGYGWTWNNICKWDLFPTGKDSFSKNWLKCKLFQNPSSGWRFFGDVIFTNVIVRYCWIFHHHSFIQNPYFCRQVVVLTWWSCWSLENEFFYFQVTLNVNFHNFNYIQPTTFQTPEGETQAVVSWDSLLLGYSLAMVLFLIK